MTDMTVCAVDVGSSMIKASVYVGDHRMAGHAATMVPRQGDDHGRAEADPELLWQAFTHAVRGAIRQAGVRPARLAVAGQMAGLVLLDARRRPIGNVVLGVDRRGVAGRNAMAGNGVTSAVHTAAKIGWFNDNDPGALADARWVGGIKEFLLERLTGSWVTDPSTASVTGFYNLGARSWDTGVIDALGLGVAQLPEVRNSPDVVAPLRTAAQQSCDMPQDATAVVGIGDGPAANLASGAVGPGRLCLSMGTTVVARILVQCAEAPVRMDSAVPAFVQQVIADWYCVGIRVERDAAGTGLTSVDAPGVVIPPGRLPELVLPLLDRFGGVSELFAVGGLPETFDAWELADQWSVTVRRTSARDGTLGAAGLCWAGPDWPHAAPAAPVIDTVPPRSRRHRRKALHARD